MDFDVFQLWSQPSTRSVRLQAIPEEWITPTRYRPEFGILQSGVRDSGESSPTINWGALAGLALSTGVSAGFWVGVAWLAVRWLH